MADELLPTNPTPTQAENDLAAVGEIVLDKDHDGSAIVEPQSKRPKAPSDQEPTLRFTRALKPEQPESGYKTRTSAAED